MTQEIGAPIREPSVDIFQTVAPVPTVAPIMGMPPCCVAANYQVVRAQTSDGSFNADALLTDSYLDDDATLTCAFPSLEDGAQIDADFARAWLRVGAYSEELDGPGDESIVIDSAAAEVAVIGPGVWEIEDPVQDFVGSGVIANSPISEADYVVRMMGVDGLIHDFPVTVVAPGADVTRLRMGPAPDGLVAPLLGAPPATADYQIILNPAKFRINSVEDAAFLRFNGGVAQVTIPGTATPNGDITYTAVSGGNEGNAITVIHADLGGPGLTVSVTGYTITISFQAGVATNGDIETAVNGHAAASQLVVATAGAAGLVSVSAGAPLVGGSHVVFTSVATGSIGNIKRVRYVNGGALALYLSGSDLVVQLNAGVTTDANIAVAVAGDPTVVAWATCTAFGGTGIPDEAMLHPDGVTTYSTFVFMGGGFDADTVTLDANLIGNPAVRASVYLEYRALRRKYTAVASLSTTGSEPRLAFASSLQDLEAIVGEFTPDNPLGLMMYLAYLNFPNGTIYGLGVDAISGPQPDGTDAAWQRAADFLTGQTPYYIAIGSQRTAVHEIWESHINIMNGDGFTVPAVLERFLFINKEQPTRTPDRIISSGTVIAGRPAASRLSVSENLNALGITTGDVLVIGGYTAGADSVGVLQSGASGFVVQSLDDNFTMVFTPDPNPGTGTYPHTANWAIWRPGIAFSIPADKAVMAETVNAINYQISNRRIASTFPDNVTVSIGGELLDLPGYYGDAAQIGQCAAQPVSRSKLRQRLFGIVAIRGSNDFFTNSDLDIIQGGGTWVRFVPVPGGAVMTRHSLTTDVTSVLTRNPTCAWQVDKYARKIRISLRQTLGSLITVALLDEIVTRIDNIGRHMVDCRELAGYTIDSVRQGDGVGADIDQLIIEGEASPLLPNNGIKFYITVTAPAV